jgi:UDPglucose 6-dehydrogenase
VGYGGSCVPKDVKAMMHFASEKNYEFKILEAVESVNACQKTRLFAKMQQQFGDMNGRTVAVWGLAFKPKTDDMREAPSIPLITALLEAGATVQAYDPEATRVAKGIFGDRITYTQNNYDALKGADCLAIVTEWNEFRRPDFPRMKSLMREPIVFDGRNLFTPEQMKQHGFRYHSIGRE